MCAYCTYLSEEAVRQQRTGYLLSTVELVGGLVPAALRCAALYMQQPSITEYRAVN